MPDHRIDRALERYGVTLTRADIDLMERAILAGRSVPVRRHPSGGVVHLVKHGALPMIAVINTGNDGRLGIATFLPADSLVAGRSKAHYQARARHIPLKRRSKLHGWGRREG